MADLQGAVVALAQQVIGSVDEVRVLRRALFGAMQTQRGCVVTMRRCQASEDCRCAELFEEAIEDAA